MGKFNTWGNPLHGISLLHGSIAAWCNLLHDSVYCTDQFTALDNLLYGSLCWDGLIHCIGQIKLWVNFLHEVITLCGSICCMDQFTVSIHHLGLTHCVGQLAAWIHLLCGSIHWTVTFLHLNFDGSSHHHWCQFAQKIHRWTLLIHLWFQSWLSQCPLPAGDKAMILWVEVDWLFPFTVA